MKIPKIREKNIISSDINFSVGSYKELVDFKNADEFFIDLNLDLTDWNNEINEIKGFDHFFDYSDDLFEASKTRESIYDFGSSYNTVVFKLKKGEDMALKIKKVFENINKDIKNHLVETLGSNFEKYDQAMKEIKDQEIEFEIENNISKIFLKMLKEKIPDNLEYSIIIESNAIPDNCNLKKIPYKEKDAYSYSLPRPNKRSASEDFIANEKYYDKISASKYFSSFSFSQKNNASLIKVELSEECKNLVRATLLEANNEYFNENKIEQTNNKRKKLKP